MVGYLCSLQQRVRSHLRSTGSACCKSPCFAGTGLPQPSRPGCPFLLLTHIPPTNMQCLEAANRWLNIRVLPESSGVLG